MKTFIIILLLLFLPSQLFAGGSKPYFTGNVGLAFTDDITKGFSFGGAAFQGNGDFYPGFTGGFGLGFHLGSGLRTEIDYSYRKANLNEISDFSGSFDADGYVRAHSFLANLYKDFKMGESSAIYIGGGVGMARETIVLSRIADTEADFVDVAEWELAFQASTGFSTKLTDSIYGSLGYKFFKTLGDITSHNIELGVRFNMF